MPGIGHIPVSCWSGRAQILPEQCKPLPAIALDFPLEPDVKTLLMKKDTICGHRTWRTEAGSFFPAGWLAFRVPEGICRLLGEQRHQQSQLVMNSINYSSRMPAKASPLVQWCQRRYRVTANFWLDLRPTPYEEAHTWDCKSSQELVARVVHEL